MRSGYPEVTRSTRSSDPATPFASGDWWLRMETRPFASTPPIAAPAPGAGGPGAMHCTDRLEWHNPCVDEDVARAGACGLIHLPTGRTCMAKQRHHGSCDFAPRDDVAGVPSEMLGLSLRTGDGQGTVQVMARRY